MTYATLCSGIGAPECAIGHPPVFVSEIEPFPCAVLACHFPGVPNYGDMLGWRDWPRHDLDLLIAGTPCQAFSVAGLRQGTNDARGNLTLEFVRIVDAFRPRFVLWENVPGVLSDRTNAFGHLLAGLAGADDALVCESGRWPIAGFVSGPKRQVAYRILDAQYFGVPQRRRRVWLCAGDIERGAGDWACAAALFPEQEGVRRDPAACGEAREETAARAGGGSHWSGGPHPALNQSHNIGGIGMSDQELFSQRGAGLVSGAVSAKWAKGTGGPAGDECYNLVVPVCPTLRAGGNNTGGDRPPGTDVDTADSLVVAHSLRGDGFDASEDGTGRGTPLVVAFKAGQGAKARSVAYSETVSPTLGAAPSGSNRTPCIAIHDMRGNGDGATCPTLTGDHASRPMDYTPVVFDTAQITSPGNYSNPKPGQPAPPLNTAAQHHVALIGGIDNENNAVPAEGPLGPLMKDSPSGGGRPLPAVCFEPGSIARNAGPSGESPLAPTLRKEMGDNQPAVRIASSVRRLTPRECERLQGFPDDWTLVLHRGKPAADGPRYKAIGNSMAVPCVRFIYNNLKEANNGH